MLKAGDLVEISPWKVFWSILDENGMFGARGDTGFNVGPTPNYFGVIVSMQKRYVIASAAISAAMKPKYEYAYYVLLHDGRRGWSYSAGLTGLWNEL